MVVFGNNSISGGNVSLVACFIYLRLRKNIIQVESYLNRPIIVYFYKINYSCF